MYKSVFNLLRLVTPPWKRVTQRRERIKGVESPLAAVHCFSINAPLLLCHHSGPTSFSRQFPSSCDIFIWCIYILGEQSMYMTETQLSIVHNCHFSVCLLPDDLLYTVSFYCNYPENICFHVKSQSSLNMLRCVLIAVVKWCLWTKASFAWSVFSWHLL